MKQFTSLEEMNDSMILTKKRPSPFQLFSEFMRSKHVLAYQNLSINEINKRIAFAWVELDSNIKQMYYDQVGKSKQKKNNLFVEPIIQSTQNPPKSGRGRGRKPSVNREMANNMVNMRNYSNMPNGFMPGMP